MLSNSGLHEPRTNAEQSKTVGDLRGSFESRFDHASLAEAVRRGAVAKVMARCAENENGCLVWAGGKQSKGYGVVSYQDRQWLTHRLIYAAVKGAIPTGLHIDHLCRNRACCHPDHLDAVTPRENVIRGQVGERQRGTTHCPQGHEYTAANTKIKTRGRRTSRNCRACEAEWQRKHRIRKPLGPLSIWSAGR